MNTFQLLLNSKQCFARIYACLMLLFGDFKFSVCDRMGRDELTKIKLKFVNGGPPSGWGGGPSKGIEWANSARTSPPSF